MLSKKIILEINDLVVRFNTEKGIVHAVEKVSLTLKECEMVAIVGESGSGKTVFCSSILKLLSSPPAEYVSGEIKYFSQKKELIPKVDNINDKFVNLLKSSNDYIRKVRGNGISMIFQDPMTSLNPYLNIFTQMSEVINVHGDLEKKKNVKEIVFKSLESVKLKEVDDVLKKYPHELSGGMRQRVMIAMALLMDPDVVLADEPTTALDVTVQAEVLTLLKKLQQENGNSIIFVTHDLALASEYCDRICVMYAGKIVETGLVKEIFNNPMHAYTKALLDCLPTLEKRGERLKNIPGILPNLLTYAPGYSYANRFGISLDDEEIANPSNFKKITDTHFVEECPKKLIKKIKK